MNVIRGDRQQAIELLRKIFKPTDTITFVAKGNTVIVMKLTPARLSDLVAGSKESAPPLREILNEIQNYRRERRQRRAHRP